LGISTVEKNGIGFSSHEVFRKLGKSKAEEMKCFALIRDCCLDLHGFSPKTKLPKKSYFHNQ
jgi:hypothetical protein